MIHPAHLPNKRPDETIELFLRRHWFTVLKIVFTFALLIIAPAVAAILFWDTLAVWLEAPLLGPALAILISTCALGVWLLVFLEYTDYYLDTWIVTNERIINTEQHGLFHRVAAEVHLSQIEDASAEVKGILHTIFNYGDVSIQTAAEHVRFQFKNVDNPERIRQKILHLAAEDRKRHAEISHT